jgi:SAM-dependent methyltransferase
VRLASHPTLARVTTYSSGRAWQSYDTVADAYARVSAICHAQLARDLVAAVAPSFGAHVLDVGAGSGVAALAAINATGATGQIVALDPSAPLLAQAPSTRLLRVAGAAPGVPFADGQFDAVVASLVVGHFTDYRPALADLVRVLRPGGRLGITTWGRLDDAPGIDDSDERAAYAIWDAVAGEHLDLDAVDAAASDALPWEDWFTHPANVRTALQECDLQVVDLIGRAYRYPLSHSDWLSRVNTGVRARYARAVVGEAKFAAPNDGVLGALRTEGVSDPIRCADEALITVATRGRLERKQP